MQHVTSIANAKDDRLKHLLKLAEAFNTMIDKCTDDPGVEAVHRLRTGSRRVQAMIETMLREAGSAGKALAEPARAWLRQIKHLRRAAGSVRDLDVHRKLLEVQIGQRSKAGKLATERVDETETAAASTEADQLISQAAKLDAWLKEQRSVQVEILHKQIKKRRRKLKEREAAFIAAAQARNARSSKLPRPAANVALENFVRVVDSTPVLDSTNLHDFRKSTKKARYVAEAAGEEPAAKAIADALKEIQDVVGVWHDWLCLAQEAANVLGEEAPQLSAWLREEVDIHFTRALEKTARLRARLLGEWMAATGRVENSRTNARRGRKSAASETFNPSRLLQAG